MSYDRGRKGSYGRDHDLDWERPTPDYRSSRVMSRKRSRSMTRGDLKRRSRSPRKDKDDDILCEISKMPEDLWESNQYQDGYPAAPPPPSFNREVVNPSYGSSYQASYSGIYDDFPPLASAPPPPEVSSWNQMALPPPPQAPSYHNPNPEDQLKKEAAIESEMRQQKAALSKQREDYIKKSNILKKELDTLKDQRNELRGDPKRSPSPDTKRFLKENTKLQLEIQNKLKTINNVVDMLNGIIGEEAQDRPSDSDSSPERKRKSRSPSSAKKVNYVYYDPEMHWCRVCNEFPPTAKDYLNHLHSAAHHKMASQHMEAPWHSVAGINEGFPNYPSATTKRTPIRGLQFFVPSTAWYCKLCDQFIGDLHCASAHLKSVVHSKNYTNFVEQNPHWETDWMSDRQKAFEKSRIKSKPEDKPASLYAAHTITFSKDGFHTKRPKKSPSPQPEEPKKKKKDKKKKGKKKRDSSSSSSSQSESSDSESHKKKKKDKSKKLKSMDNMPDDAVLEEWMSSIQVDRLSEGDRKLLASLKSRIKKERDEKQQSTARDIERVKEMQRKIRESERIPSRSRDERHSSRERENARDRHEESRDRREDSNRREDSRESRREDSRESRREDSRESRREEFRENRREEPRREEARDVRRDTRERWDRHDKREDTIEKKPELKKMPFIGKMPVFKHLGKAKAEELKKEEQKKKEDAENLAKKKQEMDAEIQRKVAEFKEKMAAAQLERAAVSLLGPPALALPQALGSAAPPPLLRAPLQPPPHTPAAPAPAPAPAPALAPIAAPAPATPAPAPGAAPLPKDFQEALDIIFPAPDQNPSNKAKPPQEMYMQQPSIMNMPPNMRPNLPPNMPPNMPFPPMNNMGMMQPPRMFGFDLNPGLFQQPQLYDSHVPMMPNHNPQKQPPRPIKMNRLANNNANKKLVKQDQNVQQNNNGDAAAKKKEEMDDLAMLGIDASDVGAGI